MHRSTAEEPRSRRCCSVANYAESQCSRSKRDRTTRQYGLNIRPHPLVEFNGDDCVRMRVVDTVTRWKKKAVHSLISSESNLSDEHRYCLDTYEHFSLALRRPRAFCVFGFFFPPRDSVRTKLQSARVVQAGPIAFLFHKCTQIA